MSGKEREHMKKIIALFLALSLLVCMSSNAFAETGDDEAPATVVETTPEPASAVEPAASVEPMQESTMPEQHDQEEPVEPTSPQEESVEPIPPQEEPAESASPQEEPENSTQENSAEAQPSEITTPIEGDDPGKPAGDQPAPINETYNVTISWSGMSFTYKAPSKGTWDPKAGTPEQVPTYVGGNEKAIWESSDNNGYGTFTIVNNHTDQITVTFTFQADSSLGSNNVGMRFYDGTSPSASAFDSIKPVSSKEVTVETSETKKLYVLPTLRASVSANSFTNPESITFGTMTITVSPDEWTDPPAEGPEIFDDEPVDTDDLGVAEVDPSIPEEPGME